MKKSWVKLLFLTLLTTGTAYGVSVPAPVTEPCGTGPGCGRCDGPGGGRHLGKLAQVLDLSATQQEQLAAIVAEERAASEPLRQQLGEIREQMRALTAAESFDEAAVRALAVKKAELGSELTVIKSRTQHRIQAQLTPEQRTLAEKLKPLLDGRCGGKQRNFDCYSRDGNCRKAPSRP